MRKKLRRKIAQEMQENKINETKMFRESRRDEENIVEAETYKKGTKKFAPVRSDIEKQRVNNLLNRGIPSHFYKNLNKLAH